MLIPVRLPELGHGLRILIVRLGAVGDVVHALPALTALRDRLPRAHIAWLVEDKSASLLEGHPYLDERIVLPRSRWSRDSRRLRTLPRAMASVFTTMADLRGRGFDLVIDFQANCRGGLWGWVTGARERVGFAGHTEREANYVFSSRHIRPPSERLHKVEKNLALLRGIGIEPIRTDPVLPVSAEEADRAERWIGETIDDDRPLAIVHPGVSRFGFYKRWPADGYRQLLVGLGGEGVRTVVTWGPGEEEDARRLVEAARRANGTTPPALLGPETRSLLGLVELIRRADLFVGSDSGPLHIASATGTPVVALFGPKDPVRYGPWGGPSAVVRAGVECSPCTRRSCSDPVCMTTLTPASVLLAARALLGRESDGSPRRHRLAPAGSIASSG